MRWLHSSILFYYEWGFLGMVELGYILRNILNYMKFTNLLRFNLLFVLAMLTKTIIRLNWWKPQQC